MNFRDWSKKKVKNTNQHKSKCEKKFSDI